MNSRLTYAALGILLTTLTTRLTPALAQGSLTPPGAPAASMKTLAQIEPRTPISAVPYNITTSGSYYLTTNLSVSATSAIYIATNGVTLDLNGFTITSTAAAPEGMGVQINGGLSDITILNGHICGGVTNNGSNVYTGSGFSYGIFYIGSAPNNVLVSRVTVSGCLYNGIFLGTGGSTVVENCTVQTMGSSGIRASTIKSCVAVDCNSSAIYGDQVSDCRGESVASYGVYAAGSAVNCYGISSSAYGLQAGNVLNCVGNSNGNSFGIYALYTATGSHGSSVGGTGLFARAANNCTGNRSGGTAIQATVGNGCLSLGGTNIITYKYNMP